MSGVACQLMPLGVQHTPDGVSALRMLAHNGGTDMRHVILTCKRHPQLRWSCKSIAFDDGGGYNGCRSIFFLGEPSGKGIHEDMSGLDCDTCIQDPTGPHEYKGKRYRLVEECDCASGDLIRAPEDALVRR